MTAVQRWHKLGRVFVPDGTSAHLTSYAAVPFIDWIDDDTGWVYYSARDAQGRSVTGRVVLDMRDPQAPVSVDPNPVVAPGRPGFFDADGAMATDVVASGDRRLLYYIGWNRAVGVPFRNSIGVAVSDDAGQTFHKFGAGPVLDRSITDPCFVASCCVRADEDGFRMWYLSCIDWERLADGSFRHRYHIKDAESGDGFDWRPTGRVAIDFEHDGEYAISVPRVVPNDDGWDMWYSYRAGPFGPTYRIGWATSGDGIDWVRHDEAVDLAPTPGEWDGEMVCYPYVFDHRGRRYLLYNGDGYGATGFGLAVLDSA
jgi:hypothetical protein